MKSLIAFTLLAALGLSACAGKSKKEDPPPSPAIVETTGEPSIDIWAIRKALKLERAPESLGYSEASFNTCEMGYGYSSSDMCQTHTLAVINFRLQCRDSEGTVSQAVGAANLKALSAPVKWTVGRLSGTAQTDGQGYGQIVFIAPKSPARTRIKLASGNQFLYLMHASEASRVVVPKPWCAP